MTGRFTARSALVTGAAGDIGSSVARSLAAEGAKGTLVDRDGASLVALTADLGPAVQAIETDVTVEEQVESAVAAAVRFGGGLHLVFNNAGVEGPIGPLDQLDL